jgi:hypothetical protein
MICADLSQPDIQLRLFRLKDGSLFESRQKKCLPVLPIMPINELARVAGRDIKNIAGDVRYLESIGLIEIKEGSRKASPVINYDRIAFEIAV